MIRIYARFTFLQRRWCCKFLARIAGNLFDKISKLSGARRRFAS